MTLHLHKVDDHTVVRDGHQPVPVPAGWQIADGNADDARVCGAHPWQIWWLVFANGNSYGTAVSNSCYGNEYRGACSQLTRWGKSNFCLKLENREKNRRRQPTYTGCTWGDCSPSKLR